jgi:hypothetical protein
MAAMDLDAIAEELYGLAPADFALARDKRAAEARQAGDRALALAIKALRRPTTGAWLANLLVRERRDLVWQLFDLGTSMRDAHASMAGNEMRRLLADRRRLVTVLLAEAAVLSRQLGQPAGDAAKLELEATLEAAVADEGAAAAVRSGRLTSALQYTGLGPVDVAGALIVTVEVAASPDNAQEAQTQNEHPGAGGDEQLRTLVSRAREAEIAAANADKAALEANRKLAVARKELDRHSVGVANVEARLVELRSAQEHAKTAVQEATTAADALEVHRREANEQLARAREELAEGRRHIAMPPHPNRR